MYFSHIGEGVSVGGRDSPVPGPGSGPSDRCNFNIQVRYRNGPSSMCKYRYRRRKKVLGREELGSVPHNFKPLVSKLLTFYPFESDLQRANKNMTGRKNNRHFSGTRKMPFLTESHFLIA